MSNLPMLSLHYTVDLSLFLSLLKLISCTWKTLQNSTLLNRNVLELNEFKDLTEVLQYSEKTYENEIKDVDKE